MHVQSELYKPVKTVKHILLDSVVILDYKAYYNQTAFKVLFNHSLTGTGTGRTCSGSGSGSGLITIGSGSGSGSGSDSGSESICKVSSSASDSDSVSGSGAFFVSGLTTSGVGVRTTTGSGGLFKVLL